jgi:hypothetical protein
MTEQNNRPFVASESAECDVAIGFHGVPLLCHVSRWDHMQVQEFAYRAEVTSVRAGCRQVIEIGGHCSGELVQVA